MSGAITISSKSIAEQLDEWEIRNYDPNQLSALGEYSVTITNPVVFGLGVSSFSHAEDSSRLTMLASEAVLSREWNSAEEDEAWAHL